MSIQNTHYCLKGWCFGIQGALFLMIPPSQPQIVGSQKPTIQTKNLVQPLNIHPPSMARHHKDAFLGEWGIPSYAKLSATVTGWGLHT